MESSKGQVEAIWIKRAQRGPMDEAQTAVLVADRGIEGNADQGGRRQVTLLSSEQWAEAVGAEDSPKIRRANLLVSGVDLRESLHSTITIAGCELLVTGELKPCTLMDDIKPGLQAALRPNWNGGIHTQVVAGGKISVGDEVVLRAPSP